jgi:hypothetical protein
MWLHHKAAKSSYFVIEDHAPSNIIPTHRERETYNSKMDFGTKFIADYGISFFYHNIFFTTVKY